MPGLARLLACQALQQRADLPGPLATVTPNSAAWPRIALISIVRCLTSRSRARQRGLRHEVVLIPPQYIKAYVRRGKNDAIDAEAICGR